MELISCEASSPEGGVGVERLCFAIVSAGDKFWCDLQSRRKAGITQTLTPMCIY